MSSIWKGYGHTLELKTDQANNYIVKVDEMDTVLFTGNTHGEPKEAAKSLFFGLMEDMRNGTYSK